MGMFSGVMSFLRVCDQLVPSHDHLCLMFLQLHFTRRKCLHSTVPSCGNNVFVFFSWILSKVNSFCRNNGCSPALAIGRKATSYVLSFSGMRQSNGWDSARRWQLAVRVLVGGEEKDETMRHKIEEMKVTSNSSGKRRCNHDNDKVTGSWILG